MSVQYIPAPPVKEDASVYAFREFQDLTRALAEPQEVSYLQVLSVAPIRPRDGMIACADGTNWDPGEGPGFYGYRNGAWRILDAAITTYTAASVTKNTGGTATGTVANTTSMLDGTVYNVVEAASTPGFDLEFAWTGITHNPTELVIRAFYNGASTHNVTVDLYRYSGTPGWDKISSLDFALDYTNQVIALPTMTNYLSSGEAKVRLYHNTAGNPAHDISIDYIGFTNISAGGSNVSGGTGGVSDGDKGDITVTGSGGTWTIDAGVVTYAKMQDVSATDKLLGRSTAGAGDVEEIACTAAGRALLDDANAAAQLATLGAEAAANKDAASGYAGLNASSRTTKGVDTTDDIIIDLATKGIVLKDTQGTPHYWRITISNAGAIVTSDLGTSKP